MTAAEPYSLELAEEHIATLRGQVDVLGEYVLTVDAYAVDPTTTPGDPSQETWHYVGAASQPAFAAHWANYGHGGASLAFRKVAAPAECVQIIGLVTPSAGAGTTVFTLPAAYQPASVQLITGIDATSGTAGYWIINTTGAVTAGAFGGLTNGDEYVINGLYSLDI